MSRIKNYIINTLWAIWNGLALFGLAIIFFIIWALINYTFIWN